MNNKLAIMAMGYNRPDSLRRLLTSLLKLKNANGVKLIISIDAGGVDEVYEVANTFLWPYGEKEVICHSKRLGLKEHFFFSGDLTGKYENILFVEDDLVVSPYSLLFADAIISRYGDDERISGGSLYDPAYMEGLQLRFYKLEEGSDVYFFQQPYWGNVWMKEKWNAFREWYKTYRCKPELLPEHISKWAETSFKKIYIQYLIETNRYFVAPRVSLATNCADPGLHIRQQTEVFQCPFAMRWNEFRLSDFDESCAVYDAFFEISPEVLKRCNPELRNYDFEVNLYGRKTIINKEYEFTSLDASSTELEYSSSIKPWELAIAAGVSGKGVRLSKRNAIERDNKVLEKQLAVDVTKHYGLGTKDIKILGMFVFKRKIKALKAVIIRKFGGSKK